MINQRREEATAHRFAVGESIHLGNDGARIDAKMTVEIPDRAGLTKMLDPERNGLMPADGAEPGQRRRMPVNHGDEFAVRRQVPHQGFDMGFGGRTAACPRPLGGRPSRIEAVGRGHRQHAHVVPTLADRSGGPDRFGRDHPLIGDDDLAVRPRLAKPVGAVDGALPEGIVDALDRLLDRVGGQTEVDRAAGLIAQPGAFIGVAMPSRCM